MSVLNYRKKKQLYDQWVEKSGLPLEEVPREADVSGGEGEAMSNSRPGGVSGGVFIPTRYLIIAGSALIIMLIIIAILVTILVMGS